MTLGTLAASAVTITVIFITLRYLAACYVTPFARCRRCQGNRRRYCRRCDDTGLRLRTGRRLINQLRRLMNEAR